MDGLSPEYLQTLLSPQMQAQLTQYLLMVAIIWLTMGRKVDRRFKEYQEQTTAVVSAGLDMFKNHLTTIEKKLDEGIREMSRMRDTVSLDLQANNKRLGNIENDIKDVKDRVLKLENHKH